MNFTVCRLSNEITLCTSFLHKAINCKFGSVGQLNNLINFRSVNRRKVWICGNKSYSSSTYESIFKQSTENPEGFWAEAADGIIWSKKWDRVLDDSQQPFTQWFPGGELNVCYNALDRHVENGNGSSTAIIHDSPVTDSIQKISYLSLLKEVSLFAGSLSKCGVKKGDCILIYMPMVPQAVVAMLATIRLGAVHSLVFGGFAAKELAVRINHAEPKVIVAASYGIEPGRVVEYKPIVDAALKMCQHQPKHVVVFQRDQKVMVNFNKPCDLDYNDLLSTSSTHDPVPVDSMHPLYLLYTSGTTGKPKAVVRPSGGYAVNLHWSMPNVYGMKEGNVWWAASDLGWVVGHSYICYAPLLYGITSVLFEGKPVGTPNPGTFFRVLSEHGIHGMFVAPTAMRAIIKEDQNGDWARKYDFKKLRYIFVAGEHCDYETMDWIKDKVKVPVLDNWWQTETGSPMTATCVGLGNNLNPPRDVTGMPVPGYDVKVIKPDLTEANPGELGRIVCRLPLPPGAFSTLYKADETFQQLYFSQYPGYYDTMDAGTSTVDGYICVMNRDDDVINVAGHRLSTSALEEAVMEHDAVAECAVIGVPDTLKGEVPLGLYILKDDVKTSNHIINEEIIKIVREAVGPVASFKMAVKVPALPKTRSGKIPRKTMADMARNKQIIIPSTIDDPRVYKCIKQALQVYGFAETAPDPI